MAFLQAVEPSVWLRRYDGWWEHDDPRSSGEAPDMHGLFEMVRSPRDILAEMPGDEDVFVDVAPRRGALVPARLSLVSSEQGRPGDVRAGRGGLLTIIT